MALDHSNVRVSFMGARRGVLVVELALMRNYRDRFVGAMLMYGMRDFDVVTQAEHL